MTTLKQELEGQLKKLEIAYKEKGLTLNEYCDLIYQTSQNFRRKQEAL